MHFLTVVLSWLFFLGMGGSLVVIVLTLVDDFREIFTEDTGLADDPVESNPLAPAKDKSLP